VEAMELVKTFNIPIQGKKKCEEFNKEYGTEYKCTDEHLDDMIEELYKMLEKVGDKCGFYLGDSYEIEIKVKYCPEDKMKNLEGFGR
jgi:hypothetical protein